MMRFFIPYGGRSLLLALAVTFGPPNATLPTVSAQVEDTAPDSSAASGENVPASATATDSTAEAKAQEVTGAVGTETPPKDGEVTTVVDGDKVKDEAKKAEEPPVPVPFKIRPYTIRVEVGFETGCLGPESAEDRVMADIEAATELMYGDVWSAEFYRNDWAVPSSRERLQRIKVEGLIDRYPEQDSQKLFMVMVQRIGSAYLVSCREYDAKIRELTPIYEEVTRDSREISSLAARLMRNAFRPNVLFLRNIENPEGKALMELQVQAGAISTPDPSAEQVIEGDVLRTFTRQMERRDPTAVKFLRAYTLSYVRVLSVLREKDTEWTEDSDVVNGEVFVPRDEETSAAESETASDDGRPEVSRGLLSGIFLTHMRMSLFGAKGRRMEHLAVRQRPTSDTSRVRIVLQGRPDKPLVSHRLAIAYQLFWKDKEDGPQTPLVTDRNGEVVVSARENHPTFWIRVYSGTSLLARVPYAPGLLPYDVVELPDDSVRLSVEGEINLLADELIDAIALREVLMARASAAAKAEDADKVNELLEIYEKVPGKQDFLDKISNTRIPAVNRAKERRLGTRGINQLCDGLESSVTRFFSDEKRAKRQLEIEDLKRAVQ